MSFNYYYNAYGHTTSKQWRDIATKTKFSHFEILGIVETIKDIASQKINNRGTVEYFDIGKIAMMGGVEIQTIQTLFQHLVDDGFLKLDDKTGDYIIKNWQKHQPDFYNIQQNSNNEFSQNSDNFQPLSDTFRHSNYYSGKFLGKWKDRKSARNRYNYLAHKQHSNKVFDAKENADFQILSAHFSDKTRANVSDTFSQNSDNSAVEIQTNSDKFSAENIQNSTKIQTATKSIKSDIQDTFQTNSAPIKIENKEKRIENKEESINLNIDSSEIIKVESTKVEKYVHDCDEVISPNQKLTKADRIKRYSEEIHQQYPKFDGRQLTPKVITPYITKLMTNKTIKEEVALRDEIIHGIQNYAKSKSIATQQQFLLKITRFLKEETWKNYLQVEQPPNTWVLGSNCITEEDYRKAQRSLDDDED